MELQPGVRWSIDENSSILTVSGIGKMDDYGYGDKTPWYDYRNKIRELHIEGLVSYIGSYAFSGCENLGSIIITSNVTTIGEAAFYNCPSLRSVTLPNDAKVIDKWAFQNCGKLAEIYIPESLTTIGFNAFDGCNALKDVYYTGTETQWTKINGNDALSRATIHYNAEKSNPDEPYMSWYFDETTGTLTITGTGPMANYISSQPSPWYGYRGGIKLVTLDNRITSIGHMAFDGCTSLTSITIPDGVTSIGAMAFRGCSSLTNITIPNGVTDIGRSAFAECSSLTDIVLPNGVTNIADSTFASCYNLTSVTIPESATRISDWAFDNCSSLTSITIPDSVMSIGTCAFSDCSSLRDVYYSGTKEQWKDISVAYANYTLNNATIHYNSK